MNKRGLIILAALLPLIFNSQLSMCLAQGSLTPPGAPAPTMKSLDQIASTGVPINAANTPGAGSYLFVISAPGSYYLTANISVSATNASGIDVTGPGVTIDLNGFQISGGGSNGIGSGIVVETAADSCVIKNGTITRFQTGLNYTFLNPRQYAHGDMVSRVAAYSCGTGLTTGIGGTMDDCTAHDNLYDGIYVSGQGNSLTHCAASYNGGDGINLASSAFGCLLTGCTVIKNAQDGIQGADACNILNCISAQNGSFGITAGTGANVVGCAVASNGGVGILAGDGCTIKDCSSRGGSSYGIQVGRGASVIECTAQINNGGGILSGTSSQIRNNAASFNGFGAGGQVNGISYPDGCIISGNIAYRNTGSGLVGSSINSLVDGNQAYNNSVSGIVQASGTADFIMRNISTANTTAPYSPVTSGTYFGPYSVPGTATSPWANF